MSSLSPRDLREIQAHIKDGIETYTAELYASEHRAHLGASVLGHPCSRFMWLSFRWAKLSIYSGRMLRLFNTGHTDEIRLINWLKGAGFSVVNTDEVTEKQFEFSSSDTGGHYGGSTDGLMTLSWKGSAPIRFVLEVKTHNSNSFNHLIKHKLVLAKPRHYAQMCQYGNWFGCQYGIYYAKNKNDDDIYIEAVALDPAYAEDLGSKAFDIIFAQVPPPKVSLRPDYFECKNCAFLGNCFRNEPIEKNCRSCDHSRPAQDGEWKCSKVDQIIPKDFIPKGCDQWEPVLK
jgi:hypothetical protein